MPHCDGPPEAVSDLKGVVKKFISNRPVQELVIGKIHHFIVIIDTVLVFVLFRRNNQASTAINNAEILANSATHSIRTRPTGYLTRTIDGSGVLREDWIY